MEVKLITEEEFQEIKSTLKEILTKIGDKNEYPLKDRVLDNQEVCHLLKMSKRTLQSHRDLGQVHFSKIGAKIYYKASDIEAFLSAHYNEPVKKK